MLYALDLLGTFAFAAYGAHIAQHKYFDIFGILVCASLSAFGGGTLRDMILGDVPKYFTDPAYAITIVLAIAFSIFFYHSIQRVNTMLLVIDSIGLVTFACLGAQAAAQAELGVIGITILATINAVGGGILRDIAVKEIPLVFYHELYATPAILFGILYGILVNYMHIPFAIYGLLIFAFAFRLMAIKYRWRLWRPQAAT